MPSFRLSTSPARRSTCRCADCGTYYGFYVLNRNWPRGSCQTYLFRLTPAEAMEKLARWPRENRPEYEERLRYEQRLPQWRHDMQACLSHSDSAVRERAAQALASHFRARSELAGVKALLGHADAAIRRGALLAYDDSISFVRFESGPADIRCVTICPNTVILSVAAMSKRSMTPGLPSSGSMDSMKSRLSIAIWSTCSPGA